jgi:YesN/AraC family two-component response regulator
LKIKYKYDKILVGNILKFIRSTIKMNRTDNNRNEGMNRQYKDRLFKFIFGNPENKEWTLSLYNAVNGSSYTNPDDIKAEILCTKIEAFIKDNLQNASVEELAKSLGYSSVYTGAMVKKVTGSGFKKLLQKKRLEEASHLIKETDLPIDEIIKKTGYENASFFRKIFKEAYGITPLRYRKGESDEKRAFKSPDGEN